MYRNITYILSNKDTNEHMSFEYSRQYMAKFSVRVSTGKRSVTNFTGRVNVTG